MYEKKGVDRTALIFHMYIKSIASWLLLSRANVFFDLTWEYNQD